MKEISIKSCNQQIQAFKRSCRVAIKKKKIFSDEEFIEREWQDLIDPVFQ
jgi:hypothetical protein